MSTDGRARALKHPDDEPDELDRRIDEVLGRAGAIVKVVLAVTAIALFVYFLLIPNWAEWSQYILFGAYLMFQLMFAILFMVVQFVALFWFLGRPRIFWVMPGETGVGFKDYRGNDEVLEIARRVVTLLRGVKGFKDMGGQVHRGMLLIGPPGTGKSYLAQCISTEAGVPFGYLSAPSIMGMFMGMDVLRIVGLYSKARGLAKKYGACILFLDEIDAIGKSRSSAGPGMGMSGMMFGGGAGALNQLLQEMDPIPRDSWKDKLLRKFGLRRAKAEILPVLTMGATNIAEVLDPALLRPGRFDWKITVDAPSRDGRKELLEYYLAKVTCDADMPLERMADITIGYTPVAIKHVINEAVVVAHFAGRDKITYTDFRNAMGTYEWGIKQPIKSMSQEERRRIAYHESGHAIAQAKLLPRERVEKLTIVRHTGATGALGFMAPKPKEEIYTYTKQELLAHMQVSLASRAAEQIFLGIEMTGASHDLQHATQLGGAVIGLYGMNGTFYSNAAFGQWTPDGVQKREIERLLDQQFAKVKSFLDENRDILIAVAELLLEKEDLSGEEVYALIEEVESRRKNGHRAEEIPLPEPARLEANPL